jgi:dihydrolipoamide dehydrogenase
MSNEKFDLAVVGAGPGGYVAAIRASQLGLRVACIDENHRLGGTCLRIGCIPSKALLESSERFADTRSELRGHGVVVGDVGLDLDRMMARKDAIVDALTDGIQYLFKKNGVTAVHGRARLQSADSLIVDAESGPQEIRADRILVATGSRPASLANVAEDGDRIGNSTAALSWNAVPDKLVVIGAGYIGLELGSVWSRLGSDVVFLEALDRILPGMDSEIAGLAERAFKKQGMTFRLGAFVKSAAVADVGCRVELTEGDIIEADRVLVSTGRIPATAGLGLEEVGVELDERGFVRTDTNFKTNIPGIYALGDCIGGAMLAHKASDEAVACAETMAGGHGHVDYGVIPAIVYTHPEIASVGRTEEQLVAEGIDFRKGVAPYGASGRARSLGDTNGKVKILADAATDRVLGVHIIGVRAGDLIAEATTAMTFGASSEDIARVVHAHPTLSELVHEAALDVDGRAIHT